MKKNKLAIVTSTYQRADGSTPYYLTRCLDSIFKQSYNEFKIFLIGDKYEDNDEILNITSKYDISKLYFENLKNAKEREQYNGHALWCYGGVNAINYGIDVALSEGYEFICHLDHDDYWSSEHLSEINECIEKNNSDWICTKSTYMQKSLLPITFGTEKYIPFYPLPEGVIHSSVCMNFKKIPIKYRDVLSETGKIGYPADADLWYRTRDFMMKNNLIGTHINKLTCFHDEEGYERKRNNIFAITENSLNILNNIISNMNGNTFHNHYHILYDLCNSFSVNNLTYLEIGAFAGGSASLVSTNEKVSNVFSIDIGYPIDKEIPEKNVSKFKNRKCAYEYIKGDSKSPETIKYVYDNVKNVNILFIDGDHKYNAVIKDFNIYEPLVSKGGYIVFDDYMDSVYSPDVFNAVNTLVESLDKNNYEIIGSLKYDLIKKTNFPNLSSSNLFIIRKK